METTTTTAGAMLAGRVRGILWAAEMLRGDFGREELVERLAAALAEYDGAEA